MRLSAEDFRFLWTCLNTAILVGAPIISLLFLLFVACTKTATPSQIETITVVQGQRTIDYAAKLAACRAVGREAGTYAAYDACEAEAGLK